VVATDIEELAPRLFLEEPRSGILCRGAIGHGAGSPREALA